MSQKKGLGSIPKGLQWIGSDIDNEVEEVVVQSKPMPQPRQEEVKVVASPAPQTRTVTSQPQQNWQMQERQIERQQERPVERQIVREIHVREMPQMNEVNIQYDLKGTSQKGLQDGWTRATFILKQDYIEKLKAVSYWERMTIKEVIDEALTMYLRNKDIQDVPKRRSRM